MFAAYIINMEVNNMHQIRLLPSSIGSSLIWVYIVCNIVNEQMREQTTIVENGMEKG